MARQTQTVTATTAPPPLSSLTGYWLRQAYAVTMDCARSCLDPDANLRDAGILTMLDDRGPMSQRAVAELMQINRTIMVKLVDDLETNHYVVRARNPLDRRAYALTVTDAGRRRRDELLGELDTAERSLTRRLSTDDRALLNRTLRQLATDDELRIFPSLREHSGYLITLAHRHVLLTIEDRLEPLGLEARDFAVLATLSHEQPCSQQRVAEILGVTPPVVLWLVDTLEAAALVRRDRNAADRRAYDLTLTEDGGRRLDEASGIVAESQRRIADLLGPRGDRELRRLLAAVAQT